MHNIPSDTFANIDKLIRKTDEIVSYSVAVAFPLERTQTMIRIMERVKAKKDFA